MHFYRREHEVKEGSPMALCISVSRWGGPPFKYGQHSFFCSRSTLSGSPR